MYKISSVNFYIPRKCILKWEGKRNCETERRWGMKRKKERDAKICRTGRGKRLRKGEKSRQVCRPTDTSFQVWALTTRAVWGQKAAHVFACDCSGEATVVFFTKGETWHLSQVQPGFPGFTSPILSSLFLLSSPLATSPSCWERKGGRGRRTCRSQTTLWDPCSSAFTSRWGSGRYWFSFLCDVVPLT